jgi:hypothetical protein
VIGRVLRYQVTLVASLVRLARRRPDVPDGAVAVRYDAAGRPMSLVLLVLSVLELVAVEFAIPWPAVRAVLMVLGVWTLVFVAGAIADTVVRPHLVTADALRLRSGAWVGVSVPLDRVVAVRARRHDASGPTLTTDGEVLALAVAGETTVEVELDGPVPLTVSGRSVTVRTVRFAADDPRSAVRALTRQPEPS